MNSSPLFSDGLAITPQVRVDFDKLEANLRRMQTMCTEAGVGLWPHIKTHKSVAIARRQLELGAGGLTFAKLSEAEALLPSGVRRLFIAHSLVTEGALARVATLQKQVDQIVVALTSLSHARVLAPLAREAGLTLPVAIAVDSGLGREGLRFLDEGRELFEFLRSNPHLVPVSIYTHEGQAYGVSPTAHQEIVDRAHARLMEFRKVLGNHLPLWPGCSVTAALFARKPEVALVRPGAYVFGDLYLSEIAGTLKRGEVALTVRARVIDRPTPHLALIDAGSKTFSGDKTPEGLSASCFDGRDLRVSRVSEEHGFVIGSDVDSLRIGDLVDFIPAHVCPVVNLARHLVVFGNGRPEQVWPIEAGGCSY